MRKASKVWSEKTSRAGREEKKGRDPESRIQRGTLAATELFYPKSRKEGREKPAEERKRAMERQGNAGETGLRRLEGLRTSHCTPSVE
jgi:hypothetical protein